MPIANQEVEIGPGGSIIVSGGSTAGGAPVVSVNSITGPSVSLDSDNIPEGASNLYHTDSRVENTILSSVFPNFGEFVFGDTVSSLLSKLAYKSTLWGVVDLDYTFNSTALNPIPNLALTLDPGKWIVEASLPGVYNAGADVTLDCVTTIGVVTGSVFYGSVENARVFEGGYDSPTNVLLQNGADVLFANIYADVSSTDTISLHIGNRTGTNSQTIRAGAWIKAQRIA